MPKIQHTRRLLGVYNRADAETIRRAHARRPDRSAGATTSERIGSTMLTGYQCETVAYYPRDSGTFLCRDCAVRRTSSVTVDKVDLGLDNAHGQ